MLKFQLHPAIYCDKCGAPLNYVGTGAKRHLVHVAKASAPCVRDRQEFEPPTIRLKRIR
jgi:hypothetical protein